MQHPVLTSAVLTKLLSEAPEDRVNLAWIIERLQSRSFGILLLVLSIVGVVPGLANISGFIVAVPAIEMILGREKPTLPRFVLTRSVSTKVFARWTTRAIRLCKLLETAMRPRWRLPFQATKRLVGLVVLLLAAVLFAPFPFNIPPALLVMLISLAYLQEDGLVLCAAGVAALLMLSVAIGTIWVMLRSVHAITGLATGMRRWSAGDPSRA